jgi:hypothetical protein
MMRWMKKAVLGLTLAVMTTSCSPGAVQTFVNDVTQYVQYASGVLSFLESIWPAIAPLLGSSQEAAASTQFALADNAAHKALVVATDAANTAEATQTVGGPIANLTAIFAPCVDAIAQVESVIATYQGSTVSVPHVGATASQDIVDAQAMIQMMRTWKFRSKFQSSSPGA